MVREWCIGGYLEVFAIDKGIVVDRVSVFHVYVIVIIPCIKRLVWVAGELHDARLRVHARVEWM